jgi:alpha-mannosidase
MSSRLTPVACAALAAILASAPLRAQDVPIRRWLVRGPVPAADGPLHDYLGGTAAILPDSGDSVAGGRFVVADADSLGGIDLNRLFTGTTDRSTAYAHAYVYSPDERTVLLVMDSDDDLVAWLNGQRVWVHVVARGMQSGSDTATIRLAAGWNSMLLEAVNRSGGFGVLGRLARAPGEASLDGIRWQYRRPADVHSHHYPAATVTASTLRSTEPPLWNRDRLEVPATFTVTVWGRDSLGGAVTRVTQDTSSWAAESLTVLAPGTPRSLHLRARFDDLSNAALGASPLAVTVTSAGVVRRVALPVDPDWLLRVWGGRLSTGTWVTDSSAAGRHAQVRLIVPRALAGQAVDLAVAEFGPRARYQVNGAQGSWRDGALELCAPCRAGDTLAVRISLEAGRPWWTFPAAQVRDAGYAEFADGYGYAQQLAGQAPAIARPDPHEWLAALNGSQPRAYAQLVDRYASAYAPLAARIRRDTLHLVGNSHIDAAWLWPWSETSGDVIPNTWRTSLKLAAMFPGYVFAGSAAAYYDAMDRLQPTLADSLRAAVDAGQWAIVGGWWVEPDQNIPSGESLARQGLYGQRYFQRRYGHRARVGWTPDSFGYPWTLPQIYRQAGLDYFVTQKIRWNDSTQLPYDAFWWEGRDGTRLFTYNPFGYDHDLAPAQLIKDRLDDVRRNAGIHHQIVLYGVGDHGGGPTIEMLQRAERLRRVPTFPVMQYDNPDHALATLRASQPDSTFPVWRDELYLEKHRGTYTTQARQKWSARHSETLLRTAEALAAVDTAAYPRASLEGGWHRVLFNEFHDILPGSGIHQVYLDADAQYDSAWATLDTVTARAFAGLRARMDTRGGTRGTVPVVVFNPLTWARTATVRVPLGGADTATVLAPAVPALGAEVLHVEPRRPIASRTSAPTVGPNWLENAWLRVEVDTSTGEITRLFDKRSRREALAPGGRANTLQVFGDVPQEWDAWDIGYTGQEWPVTEIGSLWRRAGADAARIGFTRRWGHSTFAQTLVLGRETAYLDVVNDVEWHETHKLLKVAFALGVSPDSATYEIPYGTIGRSCRPRTQAERAKYEVSGQRWADLSDSSYGVSILNDSKYGWDCHGSVLRLSLLRSPLWPDSLADRGPHRFRFAVFPHAGDWRRARTERVAAEYNTPVLAAREPAHAGALGRSASFASVDAPGVELTWVKRAEDSGALVLRLVEWTGRPASATVTLRPAVRSAYQSNFLEDPGAPLAVTAHTVRLELRPFEIATVVVETAQWREESP